VWETIAGKIQKKLQERKVENLNNWNQNSVDKTRLPRRFTPRNDRKGWISSCIGMTYWKTGAYSFG